MPQSTCNIPEWRQFEELVARIEAEAGPSGLVVKSPDRIRSLVTGDFREVDASVRSQFDGAEALVTIECRKRASKEDVTWIEQLATKKQALGAARTIAVSSSGFSEQAKKAAAHYGIDLRVASEVTVADVNPSLKLGCVFFHHKKCSIASVAFRRFRDRKWVLPTREDFDFNFSRGTDPYACIFLNTETGDRWSLNHLWLDMQRACDPFAQIEKGMPPVVRTACFPYPGNVTVELPAGLERLGDVMISVALEIQIEQVAIEDAGVIGYSGTGTADLQRIEFQSALCDQGEWSVALQMPRSSTNPKEVRSRLVSPDQKRAPE